jgi:hypothetical protein
LKFAQNAASAVSLWLSWKRLRTLIVSYVAAASYTAIRNTGIAIAARGHTILAVANHLSVPHDMPPITIKCPHCGRQGDSVHVKYCAKSRSPRAFKQSNEIRDESLDCYWCGKRFDDFKGLALHVQNHGVENFDEAIRYYTQKETQQMSVPQPKQNEKNGKFAPFLKREHIKGDKATLLFLGAREPDGNGGYSDLYVDVKIGREAFTWGLKADSRNYAALYKRFGSNEKKWTGSVKVEIAKDKFINVVGS